MKRPQKIALAKPIPAPGVAVGTKIPDGMDGIRYTAGRLVKFVQEGRKDPLVLGTARKIAALSLGAARKRGVRITERNRPLIILKGIHAWCRSNFEYVNDPVNVEVIQTPNRMLRDLGIPEMLATAMWAPLRNVPGWKKLALPKPRITGDSDEAVTISLSLVAAVGIHPIKMRFGGEEGSVRYVWGAAWADKRWRDIDILMPKFDQHHEFQEYQDLQIEL